MSYSKNPISIKEALPKAQNLCAGKEKCASDIRKKLFEWKLPDTDHNVVIDLLIKDKFIDEQRYALYFTKDKLNYNKWGKIKIGYTLKQKNIPDEYIKNALNEIPETEYENLLESELNKKLKTIKNKDEYTIKSKLIRFATSRGFETGKVFAIVTEIIKNKF